MDEDAALILGKEGNGNNFSGAFHFCSAKPPQTNGSPFAEVLHGWLGSSNNLPSYASGKARVVAGPFHGEDDHRGEMYYLVRRCRAPGNLRQHLTARTSFPRQRGVFLYADQVSAGQPRPGCLFFCPGTNAQGYSVPASHPDRAWPSNGCGDTHTAEIITGVAGPGGRWHGPRRRRGSIGFVAGTVPVVIPSTADHPS